VNVLVADDDPTNRLILKQIVTRLGHDCTVAEDGESAWELLRSRPFDVLLTDWLMPGIEGTELCRRLRSDPTAPYTYVVLITSLSDHEQVLAGMDAGADDHLAKPVDPFEVETRLVAARRVTHLHSEIRAYREQLELANVELLAQSRTDPLTGLGNRRLMERDLAVAMARARRGHGTFSVALFDIDHFKAYNDHYGHAAGDEALRRTAEAIAGACRAEDAAYRYGGEEFFVILQDVRVQAALSAGERIRSEVESAAIPHRHSSHSVITVSGGVASWADAGTSPALLLEAADRALYESKTAGRNRVTGAEEPDRAPAPVDHAARSVDDADRPGPV
jgi:diguanylate cyclase (GGDEF)-like protein